MSTDPKNLAALEELLAAVRDRAPEAIDEALKIVQSRHTVHAAINVELQAALGWLRSITSSARSTFMPAGPGCDLLAFALWHCVRPVQTLTGD
jgi:hypothetical protein